VVREVLLIECRVKPRTDFPSQEMDHSAPVRPRIIIAVCEDFHAPGRVRCERGIDQILVGRLERAIDHAVENFVVDRWQSRTRVQACCP